MIRRTLKITNFAEPCNVGNPEESFDFYTWEHWTFKYYNTREDKNGKNN